MSLRHITIQIQQNRGLQKGNATMSDDASGETNETIKFYHLHKPYGNFSNFAAYAIELDGKIWPTSEHYFQAQKFVGTTHEETVRQAATPGEAATIGRDRSRPLRPDWEAVKDNVMRVALYAKFSQHPSLTQELLGTGNAMLIEHTKNDRYWGDGGDGTGLNRLGELLMETRARLRRDAP
jgi:N-glycosidase YbiA